MRTSTLQRGRRTAHSCSLLAVATGTCTYTISSSRACGRRSRNVRGWTRLCVFTCVTIRSRTPAIHRDSQQPQRTWLSTPDTSRDHHHRILDYDIDCNTHARARPVGVVDCRCTAPAAPHIVRDGVGRRASRRRGRRYAHTTGVVCGGHARWCGHVDGWCSGSARWASPHTVIHTTSRRGAVAAAVGDGSSWSGCAIVHSRRRGRVSLCVSGCVCVCVGERVCECGDVGVHVSVRDTAHYTQSTTVHVITYYTTIQHSTASQADESACTPCHASHSLYHITHTALDRITALTHPRTFPRVPHKTSLGRRGLPSSCNAV